MKYLAASAVVIIVIVFPLISYLYLDRGFTYRYNALEELKGTKEFPKLNYIDGQDTIDVNQLLQGKVSVVNSFSDDDVQMKSILKDFNTQFEHREMFQMVNLKISSSIESNMLDLSLSDDQLMEKDVELNKIYLLDTLAIIRHEYNQSEIKELVSHTAILLPLPKRKSIKLKRDVNGK